MAVHGPRFFDVAPNTAYITAAQPHKIGGLAAVHTFSLNGVKVFHNRIAKSVQCLGKIHGFVFAKVKGIETFVFLATLPLFFRKVLPQLANSKSAQPAWQQLELLKPMVI